MRKPAVIAVLAAALAVCMTPVVSQAAIVYNTFPAQEMSGWSISDNSWYGAAACQFTVTGNDYTLQSIAFALKWFQAGSSVILSLMTDNGNSVGSVLARETVGLPDSLLSTMVTVETLFGTGIRLDKDSSYWVALEPGSTGTYASWMLSTDDQGLVSLGYEGDTGTIWSTPSTSPLSAFTVYGTPVAAEVVPEPSALILALLGGSGAMGGIMLRRKR